MKDITLPITTERLMLTPYTAKHSGDSFNLKLLPQTHRFNYTSVPTREESDNHIMSFANYDFNNPSEQLELAIIHREENKLIGFIGFKKREYKDDSNAEIYYTIHADYFRQGLGREAVTGMLHFGFDILKLNRIWAGATVTNTGSWKIMERVGMRRESHLKMDRPKPGKWIPGKGFRKTKHREDGYIYAIYKDEFYERNNISNKN